MSFSLSVYTENCQVINIKTLNNFTSNYFQQLLNLSHPIDLKLNFRKGYQENIFLTLIPNDSSFFIETELLNVYLISFFKLNDDWQIMGFNQPNYHFDITALKEDVNRVEIVVAISILFAVAKLFGQNFIYGDNIFLNLMKKSAQDHEIYQIDDILQLVEKESLKPFSYDLIIAFNEKAFQL